MNLPTADPYLPQHGDRSYAVSHYDLDLAVALASNRLDGTATLSTELLEPTRRLVLDLAHLRAGKVRASVPMKGFRQTGHRLVVDLKAEHPAGTEIELVISYAGRPKPLVTRQLGEAGWEELTDGVIVAAQPHGAPTWFPCNDRADDKATYRFRVRTDADYRVVTNGELEAHSRMSSSESWTYLLDRPVSPYLATLQIGRYTEWPVGGSPVPLRVVAPSDLNPRACADSFARQGEMMTVLSEAFGPYPFSSYTAVVTDDPLEIPLESASLSTFGRNFAGSTWETERLIAHEMAHQWFGNSVTSASLADIWLHEGFACYSEWLWSERSGRDSAAVHAAEHHLRLSTLPQDLVLTSPGPVDMFDDRVYKRGALALQAVRLGIGDLGFFGLLRGWASEKAFQVVTTEDFLAFADTFTGSDVSGLLEPWLFEKALPPLPR